jgi:hypothetical protein
MDKLCTRCKQIKSVTGFYRSGVTRDSLHAWCKECVRAYGRSSRQKKRKAAYMKAYNAEYNVDH